MTQKNRKKKKELKLISYLWKMITFFLCMYVQVEDIEGVELCGTLKNVVAIAAGILKILLNSSKL
jgi:glycerol-3-phosphate dehydrogenase